MNKLLSMIGIVSHLDYQMDDFPFSTPCIRPNTPKVSLPSDKQKQAIWVAIRAIDTCTENGFIVED